MVICIADGLIRKIWIRGVCSLNALCFQCIGARDCTLFFYGGKPVFFFGVVLFGRLTNYITFRVAVCFDFFVVFGLVRRRTNGDVCVVVEFWLVCFLK